MGKNKWPPYNGNVRGAGREENKKKIIIIIREDRF
jgi:hypothetical protein